MGRKRLPRSRPKQVEADRGVVSPTAIVMIGRIPSALELSGMTTRAARVANGADMQGLAVTEGRGVEFVLTLGTRLGSAPYVDGNLGPNLEIAHRVFRKNRTYGQGRAQPTGATEVERGAVTGPRPARERIQLPPDPGRWRERTQGAP